MPGAGAQGIAAGITHAGVLHHLRLKRGKGTGLGLPGGGGASNSGEVTGQSMGDKGC